MTIEGDNYNWKDDVAFSVKRIGIHKDGFEISIYYKGKKIGYSLLAKDGNRYKIGYQSIDVNLRGKNFGSNLLEQVKFFLKDFLRSEAYLYDSSDIKNWYKRHGWNGPEGAKRNMYRFNNK